MVQEIVLYIIYYVLYIYIALQINIHISIKLSEHYVRKKKLKFEEVQQIFICIFIYNLHIFLHIKNAIVFHSLNFL